MMIDRLLALESWPVDTEEQGGSTHWFMMVGDPTPDRGNFVGRRLCTRAHGIAKGGKATNLCDARIMLTALLVTLDLVVRTLLGVRPVLPTAFKRASTQGRHPTTTSSLKRSGKKRCIQLFVGSGTGWRASLAGLPVLHASDPCTTCDDSNSVCHSLVGKQVKQ